MRAIEDYAYLALEAGKEILPGYRLVRLLGRGGFGEVWEVLAPGELPKALKVVPLPAGHSNRGEIEGLRRVQTLRHPYLVALERFEISRGQLLIVMELAEKSLADRAKECTAENFPGIPRGELLRLLGEAAEALDALASHCGVQHLDIKPGNLFLLGGHIKVADFGLVQPIGTQLRDAYLAASPPFAPPELFNGRVEATADQYALAVTYQELLTGTRPYNARDIDSLLLQHANQRPDVSQLPIHDQAIVLRALSRRPEDRFPSCTEFVQALVRAHHFGSQGATADQSSRDEVAPRDSFDLPSPIHRTARPMFLPSRPASTRNRDAVTTMSIRNGSVPTRTMTPLTPMESEPSGERRQERFAVPLPKDFFEQRLGTFLAEKGAEAGPPCSEGFIVRFRQKAWFGLRSLPCLYLKIAVDVRGDAGACRTVEVTFWSDANRSDPSFLTRTGSLLTDLRQTLGVAVETSV